MVLIGFIIGFAFVLVTACRESESDYSPTKCIVIVESSQPSATPDPCP